jgi:hypothetical protein
MYFMLKTACFVPDVDHVSDLANKTEIITNFYLMLPLMFIGFICNLLIVVVLSRDKTMNKTTRFLLQTLALADIMFYVIRLIQDVIELYDLFRLSNFTYKIYCIISMLVTVSQTIVAWMAVIVTYQRYVAVSRPLHARQYITTSRARAVVLVVWIGSFIINTPFTYAELTHFDCFNNLVCFCMHNMIFITATFVLPISLTLFLNIRLIVVTRRSSAFIRLQFAPGESRDNRIASNNRVTATLVVIVIAHLICELPMTTVQILEVITFAMFNLSYLSSCEYNRINNHFWIAYNTSLCFIVINSLADCVTYCIMGKSFRQTLARELLCRRNRRINKN